MKEDQFDRDVIEQDEADNEFIAHSRKDIPSLVSCIAAQQELIEKQAKLLEIVNCDAKWPNRNYLRDAGFPSLCDDLDNIQSKSQEGIDAYAAYQKAMDVSFLERQIKNAEREGKDGFDAGKYMHKRKSK